MHSIIKRKKSEFGFSLLEIAAVLVIGGVLIIPAIAYFHQQRVKSDWENTEEAISTAVRELGIFRQAYGRYACPAPLTAGPGDPEYGLESDDCIAQVLPAPGTCVDGICIDDEGGLGAPEDYVVVGTIPFKNLNMREPEASDRHLNKLLYAVTVNLTDSDTFDPMQGRIHIEDENGDPVVNPAGSAHFVVLSHGPNKYGGFTRLGNNTSFVCGGAPGLEQENCDLDSTFVSTESANGFDDRISFFSGVMPSEWQISEVDENNIHLRNIIRNVAVGANPTSNLDNSEQLTVRDYGSDTGNILVTRALTIPTDPTSPEDVLTGKLIGEDLCEEDAVTPNTDCFKTRSFGGMLIPDFANNNLLFEPNGIFNLPNTGMSCYAPGNDRGFMVEIENGDLVCANEIWFSCPDGTFVAGIDNDGSLICDVAPDMSCAAEPVIPMCGGTATVPATISGAYAYAYSGECQNITDYDANYFQTQISTMTTVAQVQSHIATLNAENRTIVNCGPSASNALVRSNFLCTDGTWTNPTHHEVQGLGSGFPSNGGQTGSVEAENTYTGTDPTNTNNDHDCWCREDYRVLVGNCPQNYTGDELTIQKHRCPQTSHQWSTIYTDQSLCVCQPGQEQEIISCNQYYDQINSPYNTPYGAQSPTSGLTGNVTITYNTTCVNNQHVRQQPPININTSQCACPNNNDNVQRDNCDPGFTNNWTSPYGPEVNVEGMNIAAWICPSTQSGGLPDPGYRTPYEPYTGTIPACTCNSTLTDTENWDCPLGASSNVLSGYLEYEKEWDCTATPPGWEDPEVSPTTGLPTAWTLLSNNCRPCAWSSNGAPTPSTVSMGEEEGSTCDCGSTTAPFCYDTIGNENYSVWSNCPCAEQQ